MLSFGILIESVFQKIKVLAIAMLKVPEKRIRDQVSKLHQAACA